MILGGGSNLVTFTVGGVEYQAEEGMTWGVWCNSSYNKDGFLYSKWYNSFFLKITQVYSTDIIIEAEYIIWSHTGGDID